MKNICTTAVLVFLLPTIARALPRVPAAERKTAIAKDAPAADPDGKTKVDGYGELPNVWTNSLGTRFVLIKPGKFVMGRTPDQKQEPSHGTTTPHEVTITRPFYLGETEVTATAHALKPLSPDAPDGAEKGDPAVAGTSFFDAVDGLLRLSEKEGRRYRLPTEAEWEYAARAGTTTAWYYGNDAGPNHENHDRYEWAGHRGGEKYGDSARPVAWKRPNPWGLYDMLGNCIEYVADWTGDYPTAAVTDPAGPDRPDPARPNHVKRSGGYRYGDVTCYARMYKGIDAWRNGRIGYRLALSADQLEPAKDAAAFREQVRKDRIANFLAGARDITDNVRRHIADGKVAGGWDLDGDQSVEYLTKAWALDPGNKDVSAAIDAYLAFLDETEKAVGDQNKRAVEAIAKVRPQVQAIRQPVGASSGRRRKGGIPK